MLIRNLLNELFVVRPRFQNLVFGSLVEQINDFCHGFSDAKLCAQLAPIVNDVPRLFAVEGVLRAQGGRCAADVPDLGLLLLAGGPEGEHPGGHPIDGHFVPLLDELHVSEPATPSDVHRCECFPEDVFAVAESRPRRVWHSARGQEEQ